MVWRFWSLTLGRELVTPPRWGDIENRIAIDALGMPYFSSGIPQRLPGEPPNIGGEKMYKFLTILIGVAGIYVTMALDQGYPPFDEPSDALRNVLPFLDPHEDRENFTPPDGNQFR